MSASTSNEPGIPRGSEARLVCMGSLTSPRIFRAGSVGLIVFKGMIFVDGKLELTGLCSEIRSYFRTAYSFHNQRTGDHTQTTTNVNSSRQATTYNLSLEVPNTD
ncbi:hypothetical protein M0657_012217 [Pyricularia oryzae]|nr:hypothetical protein M0657_012217 [Pyricularia oryzae]